MARTKKNEFFFRRWRLLGLRILGMLMCVGVYEPAINAVAKYFGVADLLLVLSMYGDTFRHRLRPATMNTILCTFSSDPWSQSCTNARLKQCTRRIEKGTDSRWMTEHWHTDQTVRIDLILHSCTWWSNSCLLYTSDAADE